MSPPIAWLDDRRLEWSLADTRLDVKAEFPGIEKRFRGRFMSFSLLSTGRNGKKSTYEEGTLNFWTTKRLLMVKIINRSQARLLADRTRIYPIIGPDFICVVHDKISGRNVYLCISKPKHMRRELKRITGQIKVIGA